MQKSEMQAFNQQIIDEFRANGGRVGGPFEGAPMLLLGTTGAKTGAPRTNPLAYLQDGDRIIIIASFAGADSNPPWYYNLVANPQVTVEVGEEKFTARATIVGEPDRSRLYDRMAAVMPAFAEYQNNTSRVIPVIELIRV